MAEKVYQSATIATAVAKKKTDKTGRLHNTVEAVGGWSVQCLENVKMKTEDGTTTATIITGEGDYVPLDIQIPSFEIKTPPVPKKLITPPAYTLVKTKASDPAYPDAEQLLEDMLVGVKKFIPSAWIIEEKPDTIYYKHKPTGNAYPKGTLGGLWEAMIKNPGAWDAALPDQAIESVQYQPKDWDHKIFVDKSALVKLMLTDATYAPAEWSIHGNSQGVTHLSHAPTKFEFLVDEMPVELFLKLQKDIMVPHGLGPATETGEKGYVFNIPYDVIQGQTPQFYTYVDVDDPAAGVYYLGKSSILHMDKNIVEQCWVCVIKKGALKGLKLWKFYQPKTTNLWYGHMPIPAPYLIYLDDQTSKVNSPPLTHPEY